MVRLNNIKGGQAARSVEVRRGLFKARGDGRGDFNPRPPIREYPSTTAAIPCPPPRRKRQDSRLHAPGDARPIGFDSSAPGMLQPSYLAQAAANAAERFLVRR
jgi:hypothetical protein